MLGALAVFPYKSIYVMIVFLYFQLTEATEAERDCLDIPGSNEGPIMIIL